MLVGSFWKDREDFRLAFLNHTKVVYTGFV